MKKTAIKKIPLLISIAAVVVALSPLMLINHASAAGGGFQFVYVRLGTLKNNTATGGRVCAKASAITSGVTKLVLTFPTTSPAYTVGAFGGWTTSTGSLDAGQTAWPSIGTATSNTTSSVTFPSGDFPNTTSTYCFDFAAALTTPASAGVSETAPGTVDIQNAGSTSQASANFSESIIAADTVTVSAVVPPTFSFTLNGTTDSLGNLTIGAAKQSAGQSITLATNAASGYTLWARDANASGGKGALKSTIANYYITSASALASAAHTTSTVAEDYGMGARYTTNTAAGVSAIDAAYNDGGLAKIGVLNPTTYQTVATSTKTVTNDTVTFKESANILGSTPAANDYSDAIQFVGAGNF